MIRPFSYQQTCLTQLVKARKEGKKKGLVVMATGLGKTITVALDVKRWLKANPQGRVLYVCHQNDILEKSRLSFQEVVDGDPDKYGYYFGSAKESHAQILFASFQTMRINLRRFRRRDFGYVIVDESHHSQADTYRPIVEYFQPDFLLGLTATPNRADLKDIRDLFGKEIFSLELPKALAKKYLADVEYKLVTDELVELGEIKNPYRLTVKELNKRIFVPKRDEEIVRIIREKTAHLKNPRMIVFCSSIRHAEKFHTYLPSSTPIHSGLSKREQKTRLDAFKAGLVPTAITVDKFNEGMDVPEIQVVVFLRSTQSDTIFYQQLGRGLRKLPSKKVLVLDFVANCDRLEMVYALNQEILKAGVKAKKRHSSSTRGEWRFKGLDFVFTEKARDILEILNKIRGGNSDNDLIEYLQAIAKTLGHSPTREKVDELSKANRGWSSTTYTLRFGSFNSALKRAGLTLNLDHTQDKEDMVLKLQTLARKLGRTPTQVEIREASKRKECRSANSYQTVFGSLTKAFEAAGLTIAHKVGYTRPELVEHLKRLRDKLGRVPTQIDVAEASKRGEGASVSTFFGVFGSFNVALEESGLTPKKKYYSRQELIDQLRALQKIFPGKVITQREIAQGKKLGICASRHAFVRAFGSDPAARKAAGILN